MLVMMFVLALFFFLLHLKTRFSTELFSLELLPLPLRSKGYSVGAARIWPHR